MDDGVLLITGGSRGIGAATARRAGRDGYRVCVNYAVNRAAAEAVVARIQDEGGTAIAVAADVSDGAQVRRLFETVDERLGPLTALVNNAGVVVPQGRVDELDEDQLRRVMDINVTAPFLCAQQAVLRMSTRHGGSGGAIVNVSSVAATLGGPGEYVSYAASKGALDTFTKGLALEVVREGIRVNAVRPGVIDTEIHASGGDPGRAERLAERLPMGRPGRADEVAESIRWLLSPQASYVTGALLDVSGGR